MLENTLLEVSYEVANKVGGIYTVLVSKMSYALDNFKGYYAIGPYYEKSAASQFRKENPPVLMRKVFAQLLRDHGIRCYYGRWLIEKNPKAILVDPSVYRKKTNEVKWKLWDEFGIDSWGTGDWFNEPVAWSKCVGILIEKLFRAGFFKGGVIAHFHEWLSGTGLLHLKSEKVGIPTVFTTHSTVLGRAVAGRGVEDLYDMIDRGLRGDGVTAGRKAHEYKVNAKHLMEKATAMNATVFTTVSDIMARECRFVLGRDPDGILPNGLDMNKFPKKDDVARMHALHRKRIDTFLLGYFLPYYQIRLDDSLVCFLSGRFEFRNKGMDIFIQALGRLNHRLKERKTRKELFAFIWVPGETMGTKPTVIEHLDLLEDAEDVIEEETGRIEKQLLVSFIKGRLPKRTGVFDRRFLKKMRELGSRLKQADGNRPPLTPFEVPAKNCITEALERNGLLNRAEDPVKVIYYPAYLSEKDGLLELKYYNAMAGCDMGVFPSYYESWGYTPLEAAALGLHSVTTDLSGFGKYIKGRLRRDELSIIVLHRERKTDHEAVEELEQTLHRIITMGAKERDSARARSKELSMLADWSYMYDNYLKAYNKANMALGSQ